MIFSTLSINRFTVHKIISKRELRNEKEKEPYAERCDDFCHLDFDGMSELEDRILKATSQTKRFFELELEDSSSDSFFSFGNILYNSSKETYLDIANKIADKAAASHSKGYIPGGLIIVLEAVVNEFPCVVIIKAEKSNAFSLEGSTIQLIKNIFLSSDKTLYKIGFLLKVDKKNNGVKAYKYFVYDDSFTSAKDDLATYFYSSFLGYSTENNSKIQTNNLYKYVKEFIDTYVENFDGKNYILNAVDQDMIKKTETVLNPEKYKDFFPEELHDLYDSQITERLPPAIIKDVSVLTDIQTKRIRISESVLIVAKNGISSDILIGNSNDPDFEKQKEIKIQSGKLFKEVLIPFSAINNTTKDKNTPPKRRLK